MAAHSRPRVQQATPERPAAYAGWGALRHSIEELDAETVAVEQQQPGSAEAGREGRIPVVRAVAFKEGRLWIAQGVEYAISAHSHELSALPQAFVLVLAESVRRREYLGVEPLLGLRLASPKYRAMFDSATIDLPVDAPLVLPFDRIVIRLTDLALD